MRDSFIFYKEYKDAIEDIKDDRHFEKYLG